MRSPATLSLSINVALSKTNSYCFIGRIQLTPCSDKLKSKINELEDVTVFWFLRIFAHVRLRQKYYAPQT